MTHTSVIPFSGLFAGKEDADRAPTSLLGVCDATQSTHRDCCAAAPPAIREAYDGNCHNTFSEQMVNCEGMVADLGDLHPSGNGFPEDAARYRASVTAELERGRVPFVLGGDHAITPPLVSAFEGQEPIHVVQWDAHPDLYPVFEGNRFSHACVAARLLEFPHVASVTQIGIRTESPVQVAVRENRPGRVRSISAREAAHRTTLLDHLPRGARIYLTVDMDGFDPAFAPEVAHPVPGGLSARAGIDLIHEIGNRFHLVGMDVVEACPGGDREQRTLLLAARLIHEGVSLIVDSIGR